MKHRILSLLLILMLLCTFAVPALANAAEPPCFTILVNNAPEDLTISFLTPSEQLMSFVDAEDTLDKMERGWETYFLCSYYHDVHMSMDDITASLLYVRSPSANISHTLDIPDELPEHYNNIFTLDLDTMTLTSSYSPWRDVLLVGMRVLITLVVEGLILFFCFRYRQRRSWLIILLVNLATQGLLNMAFTGLIPPNGYWIIAYWFGENLIFIAEAIIYAICLKEHSKKRAVFGAIVANTASLIIGATLLLHLPI